MLANTIVIADSVDTCRDALEGFILENHLSYQLLHTANTAGELLQTARQQQPQIIITDVHLPGTCSLELCRQLVQDCPASRIIVRTSDDIAYHARRMLKAGAHGILLKHACGAEIKQCLALVLEGNYYLCKECRHLLRQKFKEDTDLSEFGQQVLLQICLEKGTAEIERILNASKSRIRRARTRINNLAGTTKVNGIMRWACWQGYISLRECWGL